MPTFNSDDTKNYIVYARGLFPAERKSFFSDTNQHMKGIKAKLDMYF